MAIILAALVLTVYIIKQKIRGRTMLTMDNVTRILSVIVLIITKIKLAEMDIAKAMEKKNGVLSVKRIFQQVPMFIIKNSNGHLQKTQLDF